MAMVRAMTPVRALLISIGGGVALALVLVACDPIGQAPANPTPGQTWHQPGNDDLCVWDPRAGWREVDDGEPCEDDGGHVRWSTSTRRPLVSTGRPTSTRKVTSPRPTARRSTPARPRPRSH